MRKDWLLFTDIVLLIVIGLTTLYSTVVESGNVFAGGSLMNKQFLFVVIGLIVYFGVSYINYIDLKHPQILIPIYLVTIIGLILVLLFGNEINNAKRWIVVGGITIQVSELAKIVSILTTAGIISLRNKYNPYLLAIVSLVVTIIPAVLIFIEPDASTAILTLAVWFVSVLTVLPNQLRNIIVVSITSLVAIGLLLFNLNQFTSAIIFWSISLALIILSYMIYKKVKLEFLASLLIGCAVGLGITFIWNNVLQDYQKQRVETFLNPSEDVTGSGFQVAQSKVAIGSGMILGKGFGQGTQSKLKFLPEHQTDFIFASFAEEFGFIGSIFVLLLYAYAVFKIFYWSLHINDSFGQLICIGFAIKLMLEVFINIGMNMGIIPATGIALPIMSAGGSIFVSTMLGFGLVQSVVSHREVVDSPLVVG